MPEPRNGRLDFWWRQEWDTWVGTAVALGDRILGRVLVAKVGRSWVISVDGRLWEGQTFSSPQEAMAAVEEAFLASDAEKRLGGSQ